MNTPTVQFTEESYLAAFVDIYQKAKSLLDESYQLQQTGQTEKSHKVQRRLYYWGKKMEGLADHTTDAKSNAVIHGLATAYKSASSGIHLPARSGTLILKTEAPQSQRASA